MACRHCPITSSFRKATNHTEVRGKIVENVAQPLLVRMKTAIAFAYAVVATSIILGVESQATPPAKVDPASLVQVQMQATGQTIAVRWTNQITKPYPKVAANCGDKVIFEWLDVLDDVVIAPNGSCASKPQKLFKRTVGGKYEHILPSGIEAIFFASSVGSNCEDGQIIEVQVVCAPGKKVEAPAPPPPPAPKNKTMDTSVAVAKKKPAVPVGKPIKGNSMVSVTELKDKSVYVVNWTDAASPKYQDVVAMCGDTIIFNWSGFHNVAVMPDGECDTSVKPLVKASLGGMFEWTVPKDVEEIYFGCTVGKHCEKGGQLIEFYVECDTEDMQMMANATAAAPEAAPGKLLPEPTGEELTFSG